MIPVILQPEPKDFDRKVRQKGLKWLKKHHINPNEKPPRSLSLYPYWRESLEDLWTAYSGVCAYLAIYIEPLVSEKTVDHFIPKSQNASKAYEWSNFRLAILYENRKKGEHVGILDPMCIRQDTFLLDLFTGEIFPNPSLDSPILHLAKQTIRVLNLDSPQHNAMRAERFSTFLREAEKNEEQFKKLSPFIWYEAKRQRFL